MKVFKKVLEIRKLPSFQNADIDFAVVDENFLSFVRKAEGRPKYLVILNVSKDPNGQSAADFSRAPVGSSKGEVVAMTGTVDVPFGSVIDLRSISLKSGQGLIIRVYH